MVWWALGAAWAADATRIAGVRGDAHASLGGFGWWGAGARADLPVLGQGILPEGLEDEIALSVGADVFFADLNTDRRYYGGGAYVIPMVVAQWNLYLGPVSVFPEFGIALYVGDPRTMPHRSSLYPALAASAGFRWHIGERGSLLVRVSSPTGLQLGLTY